MPHSLDKDAEQLRLTLPLLSKHAADFGPLSYALWFGYAGDANRELRAALEPVVAAGERLTPERTRELYDRHVAQASERALERLRAALAELLARLADSAERTGSATSALIDELSTAGRSLPELAPGELPRLVAELALHAERATERLSRFGGELAVDRGAIEALREELASARAAAMTDALTALANRRAFDERLAAAIESWRQDASAPAPVLVLLDIDHFKRINDTAGHVFGDRVLRAVADTLKANLKGRDLVARWGGEEFAVLLERTRLADAAQLAETLRAAVGAVRVRRSGSVVTEVRVSGGVGALQPGESANAFVERVDAALYEAKRAGRDRVVVAPGRQPAPFGPA